MALPVDFVTQIQSMIDGDPDDSVIISAGSRAVMAIKMIGVGDADPDYTIALNLYTCHLLWMTGFARTASSKSTGDISIGYDPQNMGDKEGMSPYLMEFRKFFMSGNMFMSSI